MQTILSASVRTLAAAPKAFRVGGQDCRRHSRQFAEMFSGRVARKQIHVRIDHDANQFLETRLRFPIKNLFYFR